MRDPQGFFWLTWQGQLYKGISGLCLPQFTRNEHQPFSDSRRLRQAFTDKRGNVFFLTARNSGVEEYVFLRSLSSPPRTSLRVARQGEDSIQLEFSTNARGDSWLRKISKVACFQYTYGVRIPPSPPFSLPNWLLRTIEHNKGQIFGEIRVVLCGTGLQRIGLLVIRLNQTEFSPGCGPAVRFHRESTERTGERSALEDAGADGNGRDRSRSPENRLLSAALLRTTGTDPAKAQEALRRFAALARQVWIAGAKAHAALIPDYLFAVA